MADAVSPPGALGVWKQPLARRLSSIVIDALATMIDEERETYERWLHAPDEHLAVFHSPVRRTADHATPLAPAGPRRLAPRIII